MRPPNNWFKSGGLRHLGAMQKRVYPMAGSSTPLNSWSRRSCWSDAHCHGDLLITASDNGNVVCSVSWFRMADTLNIRFNNCLYCKINKLLLRRPTLCWNIFWSSSYSTICFANYQPGSDVLIVLIQWRPLASYAFIKIKLASFHVVLCSLYLPMKY